LALTRTLWAAEESAPLNVRSYGATGDGKTKDTRAIQAAIEAAAKTRGTVHFPSGDYVSGTLHLRHGITLRLAAGATLIASRDDQDFDPFEEPGYDSYADRETTDMSFALLQGRGVQQVTLLGPGRIDGNRRKRGGPKPIALKQCREIRIRDLTIDNAPNYNISLLGCDRVDIQGVTIRNGYSDGIDPDCCRDVRIAKCRIESRDDAIVAKTSLALGARRSTENLMVTDCALVHVRNALKLGTESSGDFKNIVFRNCTISARPDGAKPYPSAGVSIETVDGGSIERVVVSNITMVGVRAPIFVRLGRRQKVPVAGELKNVSISNIVATSAAWTSSIMGIPGHPVTEISLKGVRITARGGGSAEALAREVPEYEKNYPDASMFSDLPAYGLYCRHVKRLRADSIDLKVDQADARPALVLDDVHEADVMMLAAMPPASGGPLLWLRSVREGRLRGLRPGVGTRTLLRLTGAETAKILLTGNDLSQVAQVATLDAGVDPTALRMEGNVMRK
jgi:polygalacturonase